MTSDDAVAAVIARYPDAFDERQRPLCGVWDPMLGPCICGGTGHGVNSFPRGR